MVRASASSSFNATANDDALRVGEQDDLAQHGRRIGSGTGEVIVELCIMEGQITVCDPAASSAHARRCRVIVGVTRQRLESAGWCQCQCNVPFFLQISGEILP